MLKLFQKRALPLLLILCLCIVISPANTILTLAEEPGEGEKDFTLEAQEGITLEEDGNKINVIFANGGRDTIVFLDAGSDEGQNAQELTLVRISVSDNRATVWMPEGTSFRLDFHYDFMNVKWNGNIITPEDTFTVDHENHPAFSIESPNNGSGNPNPPGPEFEEEWPVPDNIWLELNDSLGNNLSYEHYHNYEDGWFMNIQATLEYSYDNSEWHELSNFENDTRLTQAHYLKDAWGNGQLIEWWTYCFDAEKVYLRVAALQGAMKGLDSNFAEGRLVPGAAYTLTEKDKDKTYHISSDDGIRSLDWIYDMKIRPDAKEDMLVTNGKAYVIKVGDLSAEEYSKRYSGNLNAMGNTQNGGYWRIEEGTDVTVQLIPDYGYQIAKAALNGITLTPQEDKSTFTFTMPAAQLHFSAMFTEASDKINTTATDVESGSIEGAEHIVETGNVQLDVSDLDITDAEKVEFEQKAGANQIIKYLGLNLYNIVYKTADGSEVWADQLEDLNEEITVTLQLADDFVSQSGTYYIIREHKGTYEELKATYDETTKTLSFKTDKFSDYAIAVKADANPQNPNPSPDPENTSENDSDDSESDKILVSSDSNTAGQVISESTLALFVKDASVLNVPNATISEVSTDAAEKLISEARRIAKENTFIASLIDLHYSGKATFTLNCSNVHKGQQVVILHMRQDGSFERITPDRVENGKVTFTMTSYSPIAVVITNDSVSPKTGESAPWTLITVILSLGAIVCCRKIRRNEISGDKIISS